MTDVQTPWTVITRLQDDHRRYFPAHAERPVVTNVSVEHRPLSELACADLLFGTRVTRVYIKFHRKAGAPDARIRDKAELEFRTLQLLHREFARIPGYTVPRPIAFFSDAAAVVTEAVAGSNLYQLIKEQASIVPRKARVDLAPACRHAGEWLRHFQAITRQPGRAPLAAASLCAAIENDLTRCFVMGLPEGTGRRLVGHVREIGCLVGSQDFPVVGVHPDFQPDNIVVSTDALSVLDFTSFQYGSPYSDVARFLATLVLFQKSPLYPRRRLASLAKHFLAGYDHDRSLVRGVLDVYVVRHVVRGALAAAGRPYPGLPRAIVRRRTMWVLASWIRRLVDGRCGDSFM